MYATIQKWGNSNGLRLPKTMLEAIGMKENDRVELIQSEDSITIKKSCPGATQNSGRTPDGFLWKTD